MQITESIVAQISRKTFNQMFDPALRRSKVLMSGNGSSVNWAENAGHATSADSAASASSAPWSGITDKPATATRWPAWSEVTDKPSTFAPSAHTHDYIVPKSTITYGANYLQYDDVYATEASNPANAIGNPTADWYHHIVMNHANAGGYFVDMALCFHNNYFYYRRIANGLVSDWVRVIDSSNISTQSVASATKATQDGDGNTISSTYLKLSGGTMTGIIWRKMTADTSNYENAIGWVDRSGNAIAAIGYHNTVQKVYINPIGSSEIYNDAVGKYSLVVGNDFLTYNTYPILHSNNYSSYALPLSGGTMTGSIIPDTDNTIDLGSSTKRWRYIYSYGIWGKSGAALRLGGNDATLMYLTSDAKCGIGTDSPSQKLHVSGGLAAITNNSRTVTIGAQNNGAIHIYNDNNSPFFFNGDVCCNSANTYDLGSTTYPWGSLYAAQCNIYGTTPSVHVGTSSSARISLHWAGDNKRGLYDHTGNWVVATNGTNTFLMNGNVGIGTTSPGTEKLKVNGSIYTTVGLYSEGYLDTLSDQRFKDIVDYDAVPSIDDIANAPAIHFKWNDREDDTMHVGSISQYWQKVMPEATHMRNGKLGMSYDVIAMMNTIALARKVQELEEEIRKIKAS